LMAWDQLVGWFPKWVWTVDNTPLAAVMKDPDSFCDVFVIGAIAAASSNLGVLLSTDSLRRGPAELTQTMLTLAGATNGRAIFMVGAGELKQAQPFGHNRSDGLDRMEDLLRVSRMLIDAEEPFDFDGHHVTYRNTWIGGASTHKPKIHALGGGPRLMRLAAKYADGFSFATPSVFRTPEQFATAAARIREQVERQGRDPDAFEFSIWFGACINEDPERLEQMKRNNLLKWQTAIQHRMDQKEWLSEGFEPPFPVDWHYAQQLLPLELTQQDVDAVLAKVTPAMMEVSQPYGDPKEIAAAIQGYVDAGATHISVVDCVAMLTPDLADVESTLKASIDVCRILKNG
jgi:phthiodiolone/phenolphthiodiolone dimycocerosates ketoreductase